MYGLKELSKELFNHLSKILRNEGYEQSKNDCTNYEEKYNEVFYTLIDLYDDS